MPTVHSRNYELSSTLYDALHVGAVERLARSLVQHLFGCDVPKGTTALDLGCGTGTLLGELQRYGLRGVGIDLSPAMVDRARRKHPTLDFVAGDMCSLGLERTFDLVLCTNDAMNYLVPERRSVFLETVARHMNLHGRCYIDFDTETDFAKFWEGQRSQNAGEGWQLTRIYAYDSGMRFGTELQEWCVETEKSVQSFTENHILYPLSPDEIVTLTRRIVGPRIRVSDEVRGHAVH